MRSTVVIALGVIAMVALIVGVDVALLRHHLWLRLAVNVGIVVLALTIYLRLRPRS